MTTEPARFEAAGSFFSLGRGIVSSTWPKHRFLTYKNRGEASQD